MFVQKLWTRFLKWLGWYYEPSKDQDPFLFLSRIAFLEARRAAEKSRVNPGSLVLRSAARFAAIDAANATDMIGMAGKIEAVTQEIDEAVQALHDRSDVARAILDEVETGRVAVEYKEACDAEREACERLASLGQVGQRLTAEEFEEMKTAMRAIHDASIRHKAAESAFEKARKDALARALSLMNGSRADPIGEP